MEVRETGVGERMKEEEQNEGKWREQGWRERE